MLFFAPEYLDAKGFASKFRSHLTVEQYAEIVEQFLLWIEKHYPSVPIVAIGHSMGGLILKILYRKKHRFERIVFAATPHRGFILLPFDEKGRIFKVLGKIFHVPCVIQMLPGSKFLEDLDKDGLPPGDYISGLTDNIVPAWSSIPTAGLGGADITCHSVRCGHRMFPHNPEEAESSAIPVVVKIVKERLVKITSS